MDSKVLSDSVGVDKSILSSFESKLLTIKSLWLLFQLTFLYLFYFSFFIIFQNFFQVHEKIGQSHFCTVICCNRLLPIPLRNRLKDFNKLIRLSQVKRQRPTFTFALFSALFYT